MYVKYKYGKQLNYLIIICFLLTNLLIFTIFTIHQVDVFFIAELAWAPLFKQITYKRMCQISVKRAAIYILS